MRLRVGVYNIAGGKNTGGPEDAARLERILAKISSLRCDLLGLVEVRSNPSGTGPNASEHIALRASALGYAHTCFGAALSAEAIVGSPVHAATARGSYQGNMLLSRYPIARYQSFLISDFIPYGGSRDTEPRHLLLASITLPDDVPLYMGVTHLHTIKNRDEPQAADVRKVQSERILAVLEGLPAAVLAGGRGRIRGLPSTKRAKTRLIVPIVWKRPR